MKLDTRRLIRPAACLAVVVALSSALSACVPLIVGGTAAAGTAVVITDRRSSGTQLDDKNIGFKVVGEINRRLGDTAKVDAHVYNGKVLLTGDVPTAEMKAQAVTLARGILNVKSVVDQITVGPAQPFSSRTNDTWLTSKVKSVLIRTQYVPSNTIDVTTNRGTVYLLGLVTENEGRYAANAAAGVGGVQRVVKLFETITREEAIRLSGAEAGAAGKSNPSAEQQAAPIDTMTPDGNNLGGVSGGSAVEAMPIK